MSKSKIMEKLDSLFKEELWGRIEPKDIGISKFKILDDLFNSIVSEGIVTETLELCKNHMKDHPDSITTSYLMGLMGYHSDSLEDTIQLRKLIEIFIDNHKWAVVEILTEKILEYGESSVALRALALSLERLGRSKEAIPVLENLLKIDRFDADVAKKLAYAIIEEDPDKSIHYMKLSIEGFIKSKNFDEVTPLWNKLVSLSWEDISFFERIERLLVDAKEYELAASLLKILLNKYKDEDNPDQSIEILKKILVYKHDDLNSRKDLIKFFKVKYQDHSQFEQFMEFSKLENFKIPVKYAIQDFEKNIVFDKGNYAHHNSWKLGIIDEIDSDHIVINFKEKKDHKMSIKMALQSLTPINKDHLYVIKFEDPDTINEMFKDDFLSFFEILIKSYGGEIMLADIKRELMPDYVEEKNWSKWWSKARTMIKKDPLFGVSAKKKNLIFMRDKPVTFADELLDNFTKKESFSDKLDIAIEFINNIDKDEGSSVVQYLIDYFVEQAKGSSETRQVLSYFILNDLVGYSESSKVKLDTIKSKVIEFIKNSNDLPIISMKISSYDYKKDFVSLVQESREDWAFIIIEFLFELPVRIHKFIINNLIRSSKYNEINGFIERVILGAKQFPEIYLWVSKNIFNKTWDYDWLDYSVDSLIITYFRLMNELKKIEIEGNRLKNMILDILFENDQYILKNIIAESNDFLTSKIYDIFNNVSYIEESQSNKFLKLIQEAKPDFKLEETQVDEDWTIDTEKLIVTQDGYDRKKAELDRLVKNDLVNISKELSKVSEVSADLRENVEYNALMEKQSVLEMSVSKLDNEMKKADILDPSKISTDIVSIGTKVVYKDIESGKSNDYTILGPWDANFEKKVLSYRSPIAKLLIGKKIQEEVILRIDDEERKFVIDTIDKAEI